MILFLEIVSHQGWTSHASPCNIKWYFCGYQIPWTKSWNLYVCWNGVERNHLSAISKLANTPGDPRNEQRFGKNNELALEKIHIWSGYILWCWFFMYWKDPKGIIARFSKTPVWAQCLHTEFWSSNSGSPDNEQTPIQLLLRADVLRYPACIVQDDLLLPSSWIAFLKEQGSVVFLK